MEQEKRVISSNLELSGTLINWIELLASYLVTIDLGRYYEDFKIDARDVQITRRLRIDASNLDDDDRQDENFNTFWSLTQGLLLESEESDKNDMISSTAVFVTDIAVENKYTFYLKKNVRKENWPTQCRKSQQSSFNVKK